MKSSWNVSNFISAALRKFCWSLHCIISSPAKFGSCAMMKSASWAAYVREFQRTRKVSRLNIIKTGWVHSKSGVSCNQQEFYSKDSISWPESPLRWVSGNAFSFVFISSSLSDSAFVGIALTSTQNRTSWELSPLIYCQLIGSDEQQRELELERLSQTQWNRSSRWRSRISSLRF